MVELETEKAKLNAKIFEAVKKNVVGLVVASSVVVGS